MSDNQPAPLVIHGRTVFAHPLLMAPIDTGARQVAAFKEKDWFGYVTKNVGKRLAATTKLAIDVIPRDPTLVVAHSQHQATVWCYCSSKEYARNAYSLDQKIAVANAVLAKGPFDFARIEQVAAEKYPQAALRGPHTMARHRPPRRWNDPHYFQSGQICGTGRGSQMKNAKVDRMAFGSSRRDKRHVECAEGGEV